MRLFWHRRDLRVADNLGLAAAVDAAARRDPDADGDTEADGGTVARDDTDADGDGDSEGTGDGAVLPVFVFDDDVLAHGSNPRVRFMLDALAELRDEYRERDSDLVLARGDPAEVLPDLAAEHDAEAVVWNEDYSGLARERDARVRMALDDAGIDRETHHDAVHHEPGTITTNDGDPYSVFTYFGRKWHDREKDDPVDPPAAADLVEREALEGSAGDPPTIGDLPTIDDLGFAEPEADVQAAGTAAARERLAAFCEDAIFGYEEDRDYPARDATSRLSTDLKWGTIGVREVYAATEDAMREAEARDEGRDGTPAVDAVEEFRSQLAWREFYTQVLWANPEVVTANYKEYEREIGWRDGDDAMADLEAWKEGRTGYPIVDAGMRQLREEAYMHNRVRMIVASFLTKDLLIDWRHGYDHFRERLADHDTANDNGGWQWAASTGTDAQPYFRIFNPMTQGERYDPDAEYIKRYVPELDGVSPENVHSWHELSVGRRRQLAPEYPDPIVEHAEMREAAISMFERARGDDEAADAD
ncbi:DNA photolyase family protein [Halobaculum sp. CBA1158]|uniref:cryptochrome/photolyase family protein n=1 Tax=Halobaculum sp. CBA1158 TaxID=2904243 RepID=UPI001F3FAA49|nr:deoxyribodipyrimidine photo-lyase [Halobaculum sp. CBA1158]UIO98783.1 DNA photolyase family protein [Halobaculum sp. CBA1158]